MATGVSLQESYLRGRGNERSGLGIPAVSRNTHQLTNDPFRSKIPLKFKAERLEEHPKPTGVGVKGLETLTGSPETDRLAYKEVIDSHRAPQHMNHIESKAIARRIKIEEPSRLVIRRKPPEEALRIEMLKHTARIDALALEIFRGRTVSAINVLFKDSSSESTRALGIRTCAESPAMLTKQGHVTALHVVAARTQVILHTDDSRVIDRLRKIATIGYEEWGEWRTIWKIEGRARLELPLYTDDARGARVLSSTAQRENGYIQRRPNDAQMTAIPRMTTMTAFYTDRWPHKARLAVRWKQGTMSMSTESDGSEVRFDFKTLYLHLCYSREGSYLRRTATAVQRTRTTLGTDRWPCKARTTVLWRRGTMSADVGLGGPRVCLDSGTRYLHLCYSRENGCTRRRTSDIQAATIRGTTTIYEEIQRTVKEKLRDTIQRYYYEWGEWSGRAEGLNLATATVITMTTTAATATATTTTTRLEADQWPCKAGTAVRWERGATSAGTGLDSPGFCFGSRTYYLHLSYSRDGRQLQRSATSVSAIKAQESVLERQRRSSRIRHPTNVEMEPEDSSFYFCFITFYLQRNQEESQEERSERLCGLVHRNCYRWQRDSGVQSRDKRRDAQGAFYLHLRRFREYDYLQGIVGKLPPQRAKATVTRTHMEEQAQRLRIDSDVEGGTH
ncbi:hypothetical protein M404DRAFT_29291 [Pisolithus tinctorius Marx 270]|uniref:Uncharacterized protein n=1 Tax=Pisolithus tinctorius Marx 270 TaxID=870435 RepID=A0A0C3NZN4_PISTI|nr:hypothetical protein M404DRAFT_29291 [Pisolithus tinctorius Marx 270]